MFCYVFHQIFSELKILSTHLHFTYIETKAKRIQGMDSYEIRKKQNKTKKHFLSAKHTIPEGHTLFFV